MAKSKLIKPVTKDAADPSVRAKAEFDKYKKMMDECYAKETATKQRFGRMPPPHPGFQPAYVFASPPESFFYADPSQTDSETQTPRKQDNKESSILDSLTRLLELSIKTINVSLTGGVAVMNRFYGMGQREHHYGNECCDENEYDCHCHGDFCSQHYESCCCGECHPGIHNC